MLLIDTSVWIVVFRDRNGQVRQKLETLIANREVLLTRFTQLELLQGSLNEQEWTLLSTYLETQNYIEPSIDSWQAARLPVFTMTCAAKGLPFAAQSIAALLKRLWKIICF
jgi:predicted nucleic acid-binding protein